MAVPCACGCGTEVDATDEGLEITIPASARGKAIYNGTEESLVTIRLDANGQERLILSLKASFRQRVEGG